jgi:uncharacterized protein (DUF983 family)
VKNQTGAGKRWIGTLGATVAIVGALLTAFGIFANNTSGLRAWSDMRSYGIVLLVVGLVLLLLYKGRLSGLLGGKEE